MEREQPRFLMLVGIPASGKSTFATQLSEGREDIIYLSSDELRAEMLGDENIQDQHRLIFNEMIKRSREALKDGIHVIFDATNISRKKRKGTLQQLPKNIQKVALYMATDFGIAVENNAQRDRVVPDYALERMFKNMQIPIYSEGWDKIIFNYDDTTLDHQLAKEFTDPVRVGVLLGREGYEVMAFMAQFFDEFFKIYDMPQDSKYHSFSVSRHTYYVYKHVLDNYKTEDESEKELMLWTALLHDIGKSYCKSFKNRKGEETRYANFIGHDHVGSQLAVNLLKRMNFDDEFIHTVATLIQFHMYLLDEKASHDKLKGYVGEELFKKLEFLRDADTLAH